MFVVPNIIMFVVPSLIIFVVPSLLRPDSQLTGGSGAHGQQAGAGAVNSG